MIANRRKEMRMIENELKLLYSIQSVAYSYGGHKTTPVFVMMVDKKGIRYVWKTNVYSDGYRKIGDNHGQYLMVKYKELETLPGGDIRIERVKVIN